MSTQLSSLLTSDQEKPAAKGEEENIERLIDRYEEVVDADPEAAQEIRRSFAAALAAEPGLLTDERISDFLAEQIQPEDFTDFQWDSSEYIASFCENLYSNVRFQSKTTAENVSRLIHRLLIYAFQRFEQHGQYEKMFRLYQLVPISAAIIDEVEMHRLRGVAYLYERRRTQRHRRFLFGYLILQIFLVTVVFPLLFINAENGRIQRQVEETVDKVAEIELTDPAEGRQFLQYSDGLYWSLITAGSIGYGDITPKTRAGKIIAATLGVMGVITIGVIAGLILEWITPRRLE